MKWNEVFCHTFKELRKHIEPEVSRPSDFMLPSFPMIEACRANDFDFFLPCLDSGRLTIEDMHHAAERYHLGKTRSGQPVFLPPELQDQQALNASPLRDIIIRSWKEEQAYLAKYKRGQGARSKKIA